MQIIKFLNITLSIVFMVCYFHHFLYIPLSWLLKDKSHALEKKNNFAVLIAARNEQEVIGNLIDSIKSQSYFENLITTFVVADNCTDQTAQIAKDHGAIVFERENKQYVGKGYALNFLLEKIRQNYKENFDGYIVFDADNLVDKNFIKEINKVFCAGYDIVTSYRNSKNFSSNWISGGYSLWYLRESQYLNNPRMKLNISCAVEGTGFLFSKRILEKNNGWKFFSLTEDLEFTVDNILKNEKIGYAKDAVLFDEQPINFSQSFKQRLRWCKGYLQVFKKHGFELFKSVFLKRSISSYDALMSILPAFLLGIMGTIVNIAAIIFSIILKEPKLLLEVVSTFIGTYLTMFLIGSITTVSEWKRIHSTSFRKIINMFTFPIFMLTYIPIAFISLFKKVKWEQIKHTHKISINNLE